MRWRKSMADKYSIAGIVIGLMILAVPLLDPVMDGTSPYLSLRIAGDFEEFDDMAYDGRVIESSPYNELVGQLSEDSVRLMPFFLGLVSLLFLWLLTRRIKDDTLRPLVIFIFVLSPAFMRLFSVPNEMGFVVTLMLVSFYLLERGSLFSLPFFLITGLSGIIPSLISGFYVVRRRNWKNLAILFLLIGVSIVLFNSSPHLLGPSFSQGNIFKDMISDFGASGGLGMFKILLGIVGLLIGDRISIIIASLLFVFRQPLYLSFFLTYFAAYGFAKIIDRKWYSETLKYLTVITIISGLVFSLVSFVDRPDEPTEDQVESLHWLAGQEEGKVLSHHEKGLWIEYFSDKPVLFDDYFYNNNGAARKYKEIADSIFYSRNLEETRGYLKDNNISYIWIDEEMRDGQVWDKEEEGLLFLLRNNETFKKAYSNPEVDIYEVSKPLNDR
ncbi:MAG: hypothetical protein ACQEP1_01630 [Nanobdellota archaeon]